MHIRSWIALAFATTALAKPTKVEGVAQIYSRNVPELRKALSSINKAVLGLDESLNAITPNNTATSIKDLNIKGHALADAFSSAAKTLSGSPPLKGVQDTLGLLTPGKVFAKDLNNTSRILAAKLDIIKNSKQTALIVDMLNAQKQPIIDFIKAMMTQIPTAMLPSMDKNSIPSDAMINGILDMYIHQISSKSADSMHLVFVVVLSSCFSHELSKTKLTGQYT
jgi:hypothetical protein